MEFKRAIKYEAKGRVALIGPAGSGKSYTMLVLARLLAGPTGRIAAVDTEHGSLSKYADLFEFDVIELDSFSADNFLGALHSAEEAGYAVFCGDSLSHFWVGRDGALEFVDNAKRRSQSRDDMSGWKEWRPHERAMVDAMLASPLHVICTMRTKTAYEEQVNEKTGKKSRVKIGLAPVQRDGLEYEFDLVGYMDDDCNLIVDKSRCPAMTGKVLAKPKPADLAPFQTWLAGAPGRPTLERSAAPPAPTNGGNQETQQARIDKRKVAEGLALARFAERGQAEPMTQRESPGPADFPRMIQAPDVVPEIIPPEIERLWNRLNKLDSAFGLFAELKAAIIETTGAEHPYYEVLGRHGMKHASDIKGKKRGEVKACVRELYETLAKCRAALDPPPYEATEDDLPPELGGAA